MHFKVGSWLHEAPTTAYDADGKRALVKRLCFGPLETRTWYVLRDGRYCRETYFIEGIQAGDVYMDEISRAEMLEVIEDEIALCEKYGGTELLDIFRAEKEGIEEAGSK